MEPLRARAPLDLDLEDRLIFGLTPVRFGYLVVGGLLAYTIGAHGPGGAGIRLPVALLLTLLAAALAWLRWRGRPLDAWVLDLAVYARRNVEVEIDPVLLRRIRAPLRRPAQSWLLMGKPAVKRIAVAATEPRAGATTVAVELSAALALKGRRVALAQADGASARSLRLSLEADGSHPRSGLRLAGGMKRQDSECVVVDLGTRRPDKRADLAVLVTPPGHTGNARVDVPARRVRLLVNRDRGRVPIQDDREVHVPEDLSVPAAQAGGEPVVIQFPRSRAAMAFFRLADAVDPPEPDPSSVPPAS